MADQMGGRTRYATNNAPAVTTTVVGSADEMVSMVEEAIGLAPSITFVVCCAAPATVCDQNHCINFMNTNTWKKTHL